MPKLDSESTLEILRRVETIDNQKTLGVELGFSIGKVNYILKALAEKGLIKAGRFATSDHKLKYRYILTPKGIAEKLRLTEAFVERKKREYEELKAELERDRDWGLENGE